PGGGTEKAACRAVQGVPVQALAGRPGRAEGLAERRREGPEHADPGTGHWVVPGGLPGRLPVPGRQQRLCVLGGGTLRGLLLGLAHHVLDLVVPDPSPRYHAGPCAAGVPADRDDGQLTRVGHAVRGERVPGPAQVRRRGLVRDHHAVVAPGGRQRPLHGFLRPAALPVPGRRGHVPSSTVLRIRTPRISTDGQPWLTGATCEGWPLPQLNAPPST